MRSRTSESLIVLPLLPIFLVGLPPMLLVSFLGFAGLVILGVLLICVGLSGGLDANNEFNEEIIVARLCAPVGTRRAGLEPAFGDSLRHRHECHRRRIYRGGGGRLLRFG